jgi:3-dehydroquinate synthase
MSENLNSTKIVKVDLADRSYDIHIAKGLLSQAAELIPSDLSDKKIFILYDKNTYPYVQVLEEALAGKVLDSKTLSLKGGEPTKSYDGLQQVLDWLLDNKVNRQSVLIAVGGGVIGDLGGFAASIVMRGIPFVQIPTTVLAQVDSSVGGKTGINTAQGKNLVGSFYQPLAVICDICTLGTLPERELRAGYGEIVKYGLINDLSFFEWLEEHAEEVLTLESDALSHVVEMSCKAKAKIVAADEHEQGQRALLNFGHTFGHALEVSAQYDGRLLHGEAVSIGMVMAFELSVKMGLCPQEDLDRVQAHLKDCGLKVTANEINPELKHSAEELVDLMAGDKKALSHKDGDKIGFILTRGIGKVFQTYDVERGDVVRVVQDSLEGQS